MTNPSPPPPVTAQELPDAERPHDADAFLHDLVDRVFVSKVEASADGLADGLGRVQEALTRDLKGLSKDLQLLRRRVEEVEGELLRRADEDQETAKNRTEQLQGALREIYNRQGKLAGDVAEVEAETRAVLDKVSTLGVAEIERDQVAHEVSTAVQEDVSVVRAAVQSDVNHALGEVYKAIEALAATEAKRADDAADEAARLRRWVLAAVAVAAAALVASVVPIFL